jgi:hypothetical protein
MGTLKLCISDGFQIVCMCWEDTGEKYMRKFNKFALYKDTNVETLSVLATN